jgi:glutamate racemase
VRGLTVLHELLVILPREDAVHLGDNQRLPYGISLLSKVRRFALEVGHQVEAERARPYPEL